MKKQFSILIISFLFISITKAQLGGKSVFHLFQLNNSARIAAMGGGLYAYSDSDPSLISYNPSIIGKEHHTSLSLNFVDYFSNALYGSLLYSHTFNKVGSFAFGIQYNSYGKMDLIDENGMNMGEFYADDYLITVGWGRTLHKYFSIGANLKMAVSHLESYLAFGIAADVAGTFVYPKKNIYLSLLLKNMGSELKTYTGSQFEPLPFEIQLAFSQKIKFIPVRYSISLQHLQKWNLAFSDPNNPFLDKDAETGDVKTKSKFNQFMNNFFRHIIFGIEIQPIKYLYFNFAFNYNVNQDMRIIQKKTMSGFSYGFMINIENIKFGYSRSHYMRGAVPNYFTFSVNIEDLIKLNQKIKGQKLKTIETK